MSQELTTSLEKAPQRAMLKALGFTDSEIEKPHIAIISARSELSPALAGLGEIEDAVRAGVYAGGGTPVVVPLSAMCVGLALGFKGLRYALPARELIADEVEMLLAAHSFDGAVFVGGGKEVVPGMIMGAARANIPSVFVSGGVMRKGMYNGAPVDLASVYDGVYAVKNGSMTREDLDALEAAACPDCGTYLGDYTDCLCEALGIALPYNGSAPAGSAERLRLGKKSGLAVCELIRDAITPRMLMTKRAFVNALTLDAALGGTADAAINLIAAAAECKISLDLELVQNITDKTPTLVSFKDGEDFHAAGGVLAVFHELAKRNLVDGSSHTVNGSALADDYENVHVKNTDVIHKIDSPIYSKGLLNVLYGNLAENGAIAFRSLEKGGNTFTGKAKCFNSEEDAVAAVVDGRVGSGDVIVVKYEGPSGGPGLRELCALDTAIGAAGLNGKVAVITDGRLPRRAAYICVGCISPEAAAYDSKLALIADGDALKIDITSGRLNLDVPAKTLDARRKKLRPRDPNAEGMLLRYQNLVTSAANGAVFKKKF